MRSAIASAGKTVGATISTALHQALGSRASPGVGILMYHRIAERRVGIEAPTWNVEPARFRRQMEGLLAAGFRVLPLREAIAMSERGTLPARATVITFDDGYGNVHTHAWPVLRALQIPATVFVATAYMDSPDPFPFDSWGRRHRSDAPPGDWVPLTWSQCRDLQQSGLVEIGSHSHHHADSRGDRSGFTGDLAESRATLARELGLRDYTFAFPYGGRRLGFASDDLIAAARDASALCALTTETERARGGTSPFGWGRYEVVDSDTPASIAAKLDGWYDWMAQARGLFRRLSPPRLDAGTANG